ELLCPVVGGDRWDQHSDLKHGHENNARAVDRPIAGLLKDLKGRGLLDSTLVIWAGEFGRTPMAQGSDGRDHNPYGFTVWLAGGGIKGGTIYGATDDYGYHAVESAIRNYELAYQMQSRVPDVLDLSRESRATQRLYGIDSTDAVQRQYGIQCLRARRLVESGVRFVEVNCPGLYNSNGTWDQHGGLKQGHERNAQVTDRAIAGLIRDLKSRGLFDETLILWAGEFGRTPHAPGRDGRDHHPEGFSVWLAGGGIKGGTIYGATDEFGMHAVENIVTMHDLHATVLHLLGLDHERLTYRFGGRDFRLTDVHGRVVREIIS
ncbi:MAG TPA: DUF1501 domain-containing protein, partial [Gemmataceae bacterium]|nr:DUF1501 domain-containing protein [Gemmataceae bacterium]